jgi:hypothetical protein
MKALMLFIHFILLASCNSSNEGNKEGDENVQINTRGIFHPLKVERNATDHVGNFLLGAPGRTIIYTLTNQSNFEITNLDFIIDEFETAGITFIRSANGRNDFPGLGGTCKSTLAPGRSCTVKLSYEPNVPGFLTQKIEIRYSNLVNPEVLYDTLTVLTGNAASVVFTNDLTNYNLGIVERTFPKDRYSQELVVENRGGLPAKNFKVSLISTPDSGAFRIVQNNCPKTLDIFESCRIKVEFSSKNYGPDAPDGETDRLGYSTTARFDYERAPEGTPAALNGRITILSTSIQAQMERGGIGEIFFPEQVVGNYFSRQVRFINTGYKDAILHSLDFAHTGSGLIARCYKNDNSSIECYDPNLPVNQDSVLSLAEFPFRLNDLDNCMTPQSSLHYEWQDNSELNLEGVRLVAGQDLDGPGEVCNFQVLFHPSVSFMTDGNWKDHTINLTYDSTWKNNLVMRSTTEHSDFGFLIDDAPYRSAGRLTNSRLRLDGEERTVIFDEPTRTFHYNLGRLTLISNPAYRTNIDFTYQNRGGHEVQIVQIKDGKGRVITDQNQMLDPYYRNVNHQGCSTLARNEVGNCSVRIQLTPIASTLDEGEAASNWENGHMFDELEPNLKRFTVFYTDGATYEDDLSLREPRQLDVTYNAILARAGFLVYDPSAPVSGKMGELIHREEIEYSLAIENVGTGPIPFIRFIPPTDLRGQALKNSDNPFPFEFVEKSPANVLADDGPEVDFDCYDLFSPSTGELATPTPIIGTNAPSILQVGQRCSITVRSKFRSTDVARVSQYDEFGGNSPYFIEWDRKINYEVPWRSWDQVRFEQTTSIDIAYYDGDGAPDIENGYVPDIEGYGSLKSIGTASQSPIQLEFDLQHPARLVAQNPTPTTSAVLKRPGFTLPSIPFDSWGEPIDFRELPHIFQYRGKDEDLTSFRVAPAGRSVAHLNGPALSLLDTALDETHYNYHVGTFPAGESYTLSFELYNPGSVAGTLTSFYLTSSSPTIEAFELLTQQGILPTGDPGTLINPRSKLDITIQFNPSSDDIGVHTSYFTAHYQTGVTNEDSTPETDSITVKIIIEVIEPDYGQPLITYQNIFVEYDEFATPQFNETVDPTERDIYAGLNYLPEDGSVGFRAIRGSPVYAIKEFKITNPHPQPIYDLRFFIKESFSSLSINNSSGTDTGYQLLNNTCLDIDILSEGDYCTFDIRFKASNSESLKRTVVGNVNYRWSNPNQYVTNFFNLEFVAADPAILTPVGLNPTTVADAAGNLIPSSYPLVNLGNISGYSPSSLHLVLTHYPTVTTRNPVLIRNISNEKASFLASYQEYAQNNDLDPIPDPSNQWTEIYNERRLSIEASIGCFYGDDLYNDLIPNDEKGFNSESTNECFLRPTYTAGTEYISEPVHVPDNVHRLRFYNSQRSSINFINFFVTGFIESNRVTGDRLYLDPYTDSTGTLELSWNPMSVNNPEWGPIIGYRVFYYDRTQPMDQIFTNSLPGFIDVIGTTDVTITGLIPMRKYYVRVTALRSIAGRSYVSRDLSWPRFEFLVPNNNYIYNFETKSLITKRLAPEGLTPFYGTRNGAITYCAGRNDIIRVNGSNLTRPMRLINAPQYQIISDNPEFTIADRPLEFLPQWIGGDPINIIPIFGIESELSMSGNDGLLFYTKPCLECNSLHYFEGGDPEYHPPGATVFVDGESFAAFARCYIPSP